jgi:CRISPR system Cascade subunit CasD
MNTYLILRLEGPLMAFGRVAVDELRPTHALPGQAMLTGLLANALGYDHSDYDQHQELQERLVFGARLDRPGQQLEDFQTAALDKKEPLWLSGGKGVVFRSGSQDSYRGPALRRRFYRADSRVTVALTLKRPNLNPSLEDLAQALLHPARAVYLGRASCPPALPIYRMEKIQAESPHKALSLAPLACLPGEEADPAGCAIEYSIEGGQSSPQDWNRIQRHDLRHWRNQLHGGVRELASGPPVSPPARDAEPWGIRPGKEAQP